MKKALSLLLTFVMIMGVVFSFPITAYAEEGDGTGEEIIIPDGSEEGDGSEIGDGTEEGDGSGEENGGSTIPEGIFETDDGCWQYSYISEDTLAIVEYISSDLVAEVPATIDGKKVVELNSHVFMYTSFVTKLIIPETVEKIDYGIFWGGSDIAEFEIHPDNPVYEVRANAIVVKETDTLLIGSCNTQLDESHGIKEIGHGAFNYNSHITSFNIPNTVEKIDKGAFMGCSSLESIEIPASVKSIGEDVFYQCNVLTEMIVADENTVYDSRDNCNAIIETETNTLLFGCKETVIPESVTAIENGAFYAQYEYTNGYFHEGLVSIGEDAFFDCGISEVYIPDSVESIGVGAFSGCDYIYSIQVAEENPVYDSRNNCNAIIETKTNTIIAGCKKTVIPDGSDDTEAVVAIGNSAFEGAMQMYKLTVPNCVTLIDDEAFFNCNNLRRLTIVNPECAIIDNEDIAGYDAPPGDYDNSYCCTISNSTEYVKDGIVICAKPESKAYEYSVRYGCPFQDIDNPDAITFYFVDSANWGQLNVQVLDDQLNPLEDSDIQISERIHEDVVNDEGDVRLFDYFEVTLDVYYDYIQFSDGVADSENITEIEEIAADWYYNQADQEWYKSLLDIPDDSGNEDEDDWEDDYSGAYLVIDYADESKEDHILFDINAEGLWRRTFREYFDYDYEKYLYKLRYELTEGDKIKAVYYNGTDAIYYKEEDEPWYDVTDNGLCTITFDPEGGLSDDYGYIHVEPYTIPKGYYLMGMINGALYNTVHIGSEETRRFNDNGDGTYYLDFWDDLYENDEIMVVYYDGTNITNSFENVYIVSAEESGDSTIWFYSNGDAPGNHEYIYIEVYEPEVVEPGYYLVGFLDGGDFTFADQNVVDRDFKPLDDGTYVLNRQLTEGDEIRVAYYNGTEITEYYDPDNYYTVPAHEAGDMNIFFDPEGGYENDYKYLKIEHWKNLCDHVDEDADEYCDICGEFIGERLGLFLGCHMELTDKIELFYHIQMSDEMLADENAKVVFVTPNGETKEILVKDGVKEEKYENDENIENRDNVYVYPCEVAAKEMTSLISTTLVLGDQTEQIMDYCVKYYVSDLLFSNYYEGKYEKEVPLIKAMLNYGAASQMYFNYNTENLANNIAYMVDGELIEPVTAEDKVLADVYLSEFKSVVAGSEEGIEYYGSALSLESGTVIKHYFLIEEGTYIPTAEVYYADGSHLGTYELTQNLDLYQLKLEGIYSQNLDEMYKVEIGGITVSYGAFSYGAKAMEQEGAKFDTMKNVVKALRAYNLAADTYLEVVQ